VSAKGSRYAFLTLSDASGTFEVTVFSETLATSREMIDSGQPLLLTVDARLEDEQLRLTCQKIESLDQAAAQAGQVLRILLSDATPILSIQDILTKEPRGKSKILLVPQIERGEVEIALNQTYALSAKALNAMRSLAGIVDVQEV